MRRVLLLWPPVRYALGSARAARRTSPPRRWKRIGGEIPHHRSRCRVPGPRPAPAAAYCSLRVRARAHPRARPRPSRRKADAGRMGRGRAAMSGGRRRPPAGPRRGGPGHAGGTADVAATVTSIFFKINKNKSEKRMSCMRQARPSIARGQLGWGARVQRVTAAHGSRRAGLLAALRLRPRPAKQPACALLASASYYWGPDFLSAAAAGSSRHCSAAASGSCSQLFPRPRPRPHPEPLPFPFNAALLLGLVVGAVKTRDSRSRCGNAAGCRRCTATARRATRTPLPRASNG